MIRAAILVALLLHVAACMSGHDKFLLGLRSQIGSHVDDSTMMSRNPGRIKSRRKLPNGNTEIALYSGWPWWKEGVRETCIAYFEVDKDTEIIVSGRYEGSDKCIDVW